MLKVIHLKPRDNIRHNIKFDVTEFIPNNHFFFGGGGGETCFFKGRGGTSLLKQQKFINQTDCIT